MPCAPSASSFTSPSRARRWESSLRVTRPGARVVLVEPDHRRLALDTETPDVWVRFMTAFGRMLPNISAGLRAPSDATTLGLGAALIKPITYQFRSSSRFMEVFNLEVGREAPL